jgi:hypothetical protein
MGRKVDRAKKECLICKKQFFVLPCYTDRISTCSAICAKKIRDRCEKPSNGDLSLTVDRKDSKGHYEIPNIRLITRSENTIKSNKERCGYIYG